MWTDARDRLDLARSRLDVKDYAAAIRESQACIERTVKSFLDALAVNYSIRRRDGRESIPHDVSKHIPEALKKLQHHVNDRSIDLNIFDFLNCRRSFTRAAVLLRMLTSIKEYSEFGLKEINLSAKDLFEQPFAYDLANALFQSVQSIHMSIWPIMQKLVDRSI